jgi:hypothetical protein
MAKEMGRSIQDIMDKRQSSLGFGVAAVYKLVEDAAAKQLQQTQKSVAAPTDQARGEVTVDDVLKDIRTLFETADKVGMPEQDVVKNVIKIGAERAAAHAGVERNESVKEAPPSLETAELKTPASENVATPQVNNTPKAGY